MHDLLGRLTRLGKRDKNKGRLKIIGSVKIHRQFKSNFLSHNRDIIVRLPHSYQKLSTERFPVIYMHDGQNLFDPHTAFAGVDWRVDETLYKLVRMGKMNRVIIVGIYNTPDRLEEYSDSEKGNNYIKFLIEELKPFIDKNYRTRTERENTAIMGSSMGGLISFIAAWKRPDIFSMAGCISSSFYYDSEKIINDVQSYNGPSKNIRVYIDHGEDGLIRGQKMFASLTQKGYKIGTDIDYYYSPGAQHNEAAWAARLYRPLLFFFGTKQNQS